MPQQLLHNALFMALFINNRRLAVEILKYLCKKQVVRLDLRTLKFDPSTLTDSDSNERRADAILSVIGSQNRVPD